MGESMPDNEGAVFLDRSSSLAEYWLFIFNIPEAIRWRLERDAYAVRLIESPEAAEARKEQLRFQASRNEQLIREGKKPKALSRIWTRTDKLFSDIRIGKTIGFHPRRRAARLLDRITRPFSEKFRAAFTEAARNGTTGVLGELLKRSKEEFEKLRDIAREAAEAEREIADFESQMRALNQAVYALEPFLPARPSPPTEQANEQDNQVTHADDFRSVRWFGNPYTFTETQAACIKVLIDYWRREKLPCKQETVIDKVDTNEIYLQKVFRNKKDGKKIKHPAWGTMIKTDESGLVFLEPPKSP